MKFSKKEIIIKSWNQILPNLSLLILCVGFIFFINILLGTLQDKLLEDLTIQSIIFTVSSYLFQMGLSLGLVRIYLNIYSNNEISFSQIFGSFHLLLSYLLGSILIIGLFRITLLLTDSLDKQTTLEPCLISQRLSQPPLNPVCPVIRTFLPL